MEGYDRRIKKIMEERTSQQEKRTRKNQRGKKDKFEKR